VPALQADLTGDFLAFRLRAAGHEGPALFSPAAARLIADASQGIVRRINILADKALLAAFADDADTVDAATRARPSPSRRSAAGAGCWPKAVVIAGAAVLICGLLLAAARNL
jgi:hypothetical protein